MKGLILVMFAVLVVTNVTGCSKSSAYGSEEAINRGDVVYQNEVFNLNRFEQFKQNVSNEKEDRIRVTGYTDEGDPVFQDLDFDGKVIHYTYDNSNDQFAGGNRGKISDFCKTIVEKENELGTDFLVSDCSKNNEEFLFRLEE
jgi:hypothetical protein